MDSPARIFIAASLVIGVGAVVLRTRSQDPEGTAKRQPSSMHARQHTWPEACVRDDAARQSPISISSSQFASAEQRPMKVKLGKAMVDVIDVGHTFQARIVGGDTSVDLEGTSYRLKQFHFHKPSEHILDGKQHEMEAHFVFARDTAKETSIDGPLAVVLGYFITGGSANQELGNVWAHLPPAREGYGEDESAVATLSDYSHASELVVGNETHDEKVLKRGVSVDLGKLLPERSSFLVYDGSLTTPPCEEGITHALATAPIELADEQIEHFEGYYEGNNRDIQRLGSIVDRRFRRGIMD